MIQQIQDTSHVATVISQSVGKVLDVLGAKFGATGAHLWTIIVRQQTINAATTIGVGVLLIFLGIFLLWWGIRFNRARPAKDDPGEEIPCFIFGTVACLAGLAVIISNLGGLINPEYYALRDVLTSLRLR